ncbi:MAG: DNA-directed RNA polymerase subunit RpoH/Rpb5 C-terminal domain-containing protein [Candidatus Pacearchaeota archaeon]
MHILQPKHIKLSEKEAEEVLKKFNVSKAQLPKILLNDPALPEGCKVGDIIKIERKEQVESESEKSQSIKDYKICLYYRVVV